jgi:hypothetical protein
MIVVLYGTLSGMPEKAEMPRKCAVSGPPAHMGIV